jgi:hypothetical protein
MYWLLVIHPDAAATKGNQHRHHHDRTKSFKLADLQARRLLTIAGTMFAIACRN